MKRIGVAMEAIKCLSKKKGYSILVENITPREAIIIKQEMLALGADCAVPKECVLNNLCLLDVIIIGTKKQLNVLNKKMNTSVFNLPKVAKILKDVVK